MKILKLQSILWYSKRGGAARELKTPIWESFSRFIAKYDAL